MCMKLLTVLISFLIFNSCGSGEAKKSIDDTNEYEVIETTFNGNPSKEEIQPMLEAVMQRCSMETNRQNILSAANVLLVLRKKSVVGVTEMDILKHMYQKGISNSFETQAALSATILETSK